MAAELTNYTRIKNDVLELLASGVLSKRELQIVLIVIRESWGWDGGGSNWTKKPIGPSALMQRTGMDRSNAQKTLSSLVGRNVLLAQESPEGFRLSFNEHFEEWSNQPQPDGQNNHGAWSNQPQPVVKTTTDTAFKESCDNGLQDPKEILKERSKENTSKGGEDLTRSGTHKFTETDMKLAERLAYRIRQNKPDARLPKDLNQWANTMRLMREQDNREPRRIAQVIDWCQKDSFWCANILSADKLRIQFDRLELTMDRQCKKAQPEEQSSNRLSRMYAETDRTLAELTGGGST